MRDGPGRRPRPLRFLPDAPRTSREQVRDNRAEWWRARCPEAWNPGRGGCAEPPGPQVPSGRAEYLDANPPGGCARRGGAPQLTAGMGVTIHLALRGSTRACYRCRDPRMDLPA